MSKWIRKGDKVVVVSGNEKGRTGKVNSRQGDYAVVAGLNIRKKHVRPKSRAAQGIIEIEMPIHISNISLSDSEGKPVKVEVKINKNGEKELVYLVDDKEVLYRPVKHAYAK